MKYRLSTQDVSIPKNFFNTDHPGLQVVVLQGKNLGLTFDDPYSLRRDHH